MTEQTGIAPTGFARALTGDDWHRKGIAPMGDETLRNGKAMIRSANHCNGTAKFSEATVLDRTDPYRKGNVGIENHGKGIAQSK